MKKLLSAITFGAWDGGNHAVPDESLAAKIKIAIEKNLEKKKTLEPLGFAPDKSFEPNKSCITKLSQLLATKWTYQDILDIQISLDICGIKIMSKLFLDTNLKTYLATNPSFVGIVTFESLNRVPIRAQQDIPKLFYSGGELLFNSHPELYNKMLMFREFRVLSFVSVSNNTSMIRYVPDGGKFTPCYPAAINLLLNAYGYKSMGKSELEQCFKQGHAISFITELLRSRGCTVHAQTFQCFTNMFGEDDKMDVKKCLQNVMTFIGELETPAIIIVNKHSLFYNPNTHTVHDTFNAIYYLDDLENHYEHTSIKYIYIIYIDACEPKQLKTKYSSRFFPAEYEQPFKKKTFMTKKHSMNRNDPVDAIYLNRGQRRLPDEQQSIDNARLIYENVRQSMRDDHKLDVDKDLSSINDRISYPDIEDVYEYYNKNDNRKSSDLNLDSEQLLGRKIHRIFPEDTDSVLNAYNLASSVVLQPAIKREENWDFSNNVARRTKDNYRDSDSEDLVSDINYYNP